MSDWTLAFVLPLALGSIAVAGCGLGEVSSLSDTPDIPDEFPQLDPLDSARIDVVIDGDAYDDEGLCRHGPTTEAAGVRFRVSVGFFEVSVVGRDIEQYSSNAGQITASWGGPDTYVSSLECGESVVRFAGEDFFEGISGEEVATWGTLQLVLCNELGEQLEVSGKFSCVL